MKIEEEINENLAKLRSLKEEVVQDEKLYSILEEAEERMEDLLKSDDETFDSIIRGLYNKGYNLEYIVNELKYQYGLGEDAEDIVDAWAEHEGVELYSFGGIMNKKFSFRDLFFGKKFSTGGLFEKAKRRASKTEEEIKEREYPEVVIKGLTPKLKLFETIDSEIKEKTAELEMIKNDLKEIGKTEFVKMYKTKKKNPNTFLLRGEQGGCVMIIPTDGYLKIDYQRSREISKDYGREFIEEETVFSFDPIMLEKYSKEISDLILNSKNIAEEDKDRIIVAKTTYKIKKGTIDKLSDYSNMQEVLDAIQPIFQVKNCR